MPENKSNLRAILTSADIIEVAVYKSYTSNEIESFKLYENDRYIRSIKPISKSESKSSFIYTLSVGYEFKIGMEYRILDDRQEGTYLNIDLLSKSADFEKRFRYDGKLGAIYEKERTTFRLFSPLASTVFVHILKKDDQEEHFIKMHRLQEGVYEAVLEGDYDGVAYTYVARLNGEFLEAPDPYSFSLGSNSHYSYVVDLDKVKKAFDDHQDLRPRISRQCEAVIYELSVRDMTSLTNIADKGRFTALARSGLKTAEGFPIGLDYIKELGVNYIQLLPIFDFQSVDEDHPFSGYNWGYDPKFFFAPEGGYATQPDDPYCRLMELKELVSVYHQNGIGVIMDVVYNHVFNHLSNALNVLCPDYYVRLNNDGTISNGSGCGNDFESRNYMARKLIIDSLLHFVEVFGIDGYRFDLMGIIDVETMNKAYSELKKIKPDILVYGEGWDMMTNLPGNEKSSMYNADKLMPIGFFNDRFRDIAKGKSSDSELTNKGYLTGDPNYIDGFKNIILASSVALAFPPLFSSPRQSINYVECHDNSTLFDKLKVCLLGAKEEDILRRIKLINAMTIFSFGIPFIHAGQEYGATKKGIGNSYNSGDIINGFDYETAFKRKELINYLKDAITLRKRLPFLSADDKKDLTDHVSFENLDRGGLAIIYTFDHEKYYLLINPTDQTLSYQFDTYAKIIFNEAGLLDENRFSQLIMINKSSLVMAKISRN